MPNPPGKPLDQTVESLVLSQLKRDRDSALQAFVTVKNLFGDKGVAPIVLLPVACLAGAVVILVRPALTLAIAGIMQLAPAAAEVVLEQLAKAKEDNAEGMGALFAAAVNDLLGTELAPDALSLAGAARGEAGRLQSLGGAIYDHFEKVFAPEGTVTAESGLAAAKEFTGFGIDFSLMHQFIAATAELCSMGQLETFRELGDSIGRTLALERSQRRILGKLVDVTVADPYEWYANRKYRTTRLSVVELVKMYHAGKLTLDQCRVELSYKGYRDADIEFLIEVNHPRNGGITEAEIMRLYRWGTIPRTKVVEFFAGNEELAAFNIEAASLERADSRAAEYLNLLESQLADGAITWQWFLGAIDRLPMTTEEREWELRFMGAKLETPRKRLTWAEVKAAYIGALITLDYVDRWLEVEGYSDEDALIKTFQLLQDFAKDVELEKERLARKKRQEERLLKGTPTVKTDAAALTAAADKLAEREAPPPAA